jgi:IS5 family transposase
VLTDSEDDCWAEAVKMIKAKIRTKVEHPFRVIKQQFGFGKARYKGVGKNTSQLYMLFVLSNIWQAEKALLA